MKTYSPKPEHIQRRWYVLDADEQILGRLASEAAHILRGKHKPIYAPHMDVGDHVIIVNAAKVALSGGKEKKKVAYRHSGHPGGITGTLYEDLLVKRPAFAVEKAVRGMLPKNRLGRAMIKKLHVVAGPDHRHQAQKPEAWAIGTRPAWEGLPAPEIRESAVPKTRKAEPDEAGTTASTMSSSAAKPAARKTTATRKSAAAKPTTRKATATKKTTAARKTTTSKKKTATKKPAAKKPAATKKTTATRAGTKKET